MWRWARDKRRYRFVQDTRYGRKVLAESNDIAEIVEAVTHYVAARIIERERALAEDEGPLHARLHREPAWQPAPLALAHDPGVPVRADRGLCRFVRGALGRRVAAAALARLVHANSGWRLISPKPPPRQPRETIVQRHAPQAPSIS